MKRVSTFEYLQKKNIVEDFENGKYTSTTSISDTEFDRINNKLDEYYEVISKFNVPATGSLTPEQQTNLLNKIDQLEIAIEELRQVAYDEVTIDDGTMDISNIK